MYRGRWRSRTFRASDLCTRRCPRQDRIPRPSNILSYRYIVYECFLFLWVSLSGPSRNLIDWIWVWIWVWKWECDMGMVKALSGPLVDVPQARPIYLESIVSLPRG